MKIKIRLVAEVDCGSEQSWEEIRDYLKSSPADAIEWATTGDKSSLEVVNEETGETVEL